MNAPSEKPTRPLLRVAWGHVGQNMQGLLNAQTLVALVFLLGYPLFDAVPQEILFKIRHYISAQYNVSTQPVSASPYRGTDSTNQRPNGASPLALPSSRSDEITSGSDLVFITLDDAYAEQHRYPQVTPRAYLDSLVRAVSEHHPRVIALDFKFSTADLSDPDYARLCKRLRDASDRGITVVLPTAVQRDRDWYRVLPFPPASLRTESLVGYANLLGRPVENADLTRPIGPTGARVPSFALAALMGYLQPDEITRARTAAHPSGDAQASDGCSFTDRDVSCTSDGTPGTSIVSLWQKIAPETMDATFDQMTGGRRIVPINYRGPVRAGSMSVHSAETLFRVPGAMDALVRDKLVLIGATFEDPEGQDTFATPFGDMRGAEVHATVLHGLLDGDRLYAMSGWTSVIFCLALGLFLFLLAFRCRFQMMLTTVAVAVLYAGACIGLFTFGSVLLPAGPGLAVIGVTGLLLHKATHVWHPVLCHCRDAWQRVKCQLPVVLTGTDADPPSAGDASSMEDMSTDTQSSQATSPETPSSEIPFIDVASQRLTSPVPGVKRDDAPAGDSGPG